MNSTSWAWTTCNCSTFAPIRNCPYSCLCPKIGKPLFYEGELYSEEHRRKFTTEEAGFQVVKDPKDKSKLALAINGQVIGEWFKEQFGRLFSSVKRTVEPLRIDKGMEL